MQVVVQQVKTCKECVRNEKPMLLHVFQYDLNIASTQKEV